MRLSNRAVDFHEYTVRSTERPKLFFLIVKLVTLESVDILRISLLPLQDILGPI